MSEPLLSVDDAAGRLKLHPKTILRYIREGRLRARRLGKAYRIHRADLEVFAGVAGIETPAPARHPPVTSIVDLHDITPQRAKKFAACVVNALNAKPEGEHPLRADVVYRPESDQLKIVIVGSLGDSSNLLGLIKIWDEQLT